MATPQIKLNNISHVKQPKRFYLQQESRLYQRPLWLRWWMVWYLLLPVCLRLARYWIPISPLHVSHWHDHLNMVKVAFSRKHLPNSDPTIRMLRQKLIHNKPTVFFQSSVVQIWWGLANCSLSFLFLAERSGTSSTVAHLLQDWTRCVFWDALLRTLVITNSYW